MNNSDTPTIIIDRRMIPDRRLREGGERPAAERMVQRKREIGRRNTDRWAQQRQRA